MNIGIRIKQRRKALKMSADELAQRLGKDRSTIYRYEKGDIENLPLDILEPIAAALNTTPQFLMGWEEQDEKLSPSEETLTEGEKLWLELYRKTPEASRPMLQLLFETFGNIPESSQQMVLGMLRVVEKENK